VIVIPPSTESPIVANTRMARIFLTPDLAKKNRQRQGLSKTAFVGDWDTNRFDMVGETDGNSLMSPAVTFNSVPKAFKDAIDYGTMYKRPKLKS